MSLFPLSYLVLSSCNVKSRCRFQPRGGSPYLLIFNLPSLFPFWPFDLLQRFCYWSHISCQPGHRRVISLTRSSSYDLTSVKQERAGDAAGTEEDRGGPDI